MNAKAAKPLARTRVEVSEFFRSEEELACSSTLPLAVKVRGEPLLERFAGGFESLTEEPGGLPGALETDDFSGGPLMVLLGALDFGQKLLLLRSTPALRRLSIWERRSRRHRSISARNFSSPLRR